MSAKHKLYCMNVKCSVYPNVEACNWTVSEPGANELARNNRVSSDCGIVKNLFGRVCMMFGVMTGQYRWSWERFGLIVDFCFSMANFHIRQHPLCEQDFKYYQSVFEDFKRRKDLARKRGKKRQQKHRTCQPRVEAAMEELEHEDEIGYGGGSAEVPGFLQDEDGTCDVLSVCVLPFKC